MRNFYWWIIYILLLCAILTACGKRYDLLFHKWSTYTIHKGDNYSGYRIEIFPKNNVLEFDAEFNESAIYNTVDPSNQGDINKLFGFTDCSSPAHENSARFGWNWYGDKLNIYAYCYKDGKVSNQLITFININQVYHYEIELLDNKYIFKVNGARVEMDRGCSHGLKYYQFPYFGGTEPAPHEIKIRIKN